MTDETGTQLYKPQIAAVDKAIEVIEPGVAKLAAEVEGITVTADNVNEVSSLFARLRNAIKLTEKARTDITGKLNAQKREIDGRFRPFKEDLEKLSSEVSDAMSAYNAKVRAEQAAAEAAERERQAAIAKAEAEAQERAAAAARTAWDSGKSLEEVTAAADAEIEPAPAPEPVRPAPPAVKRVRTGEATVSMRTVWEFEVYDPSKVPMNYKVVAEALIKRAVASGVREIPGVRIYSKDVPRARRV